jgi:glucokinase
MGTKRKRIALGLDIGGTKLKSIALDESGRILADYQTDSKASLGPKAVRGALRRCVAHFRDEGIAFSSIGVGCAGSVEPRSGVVRNSPNFRNWKDVPLRQWMEDDFQVPVVIDNDANCAVFTEWKVGNAVGLENVVLLTLGTGIGGGVILGGKLFRGATGTGGEVGHMSIYVDGEPCPCGHRGCFERYCSATAIRGRAGGVSAKEIFLRSEEPFFADVIEQYLEDFQAGLANLANIFDPQRILLGGAMSAGVSRYLSRIESGVKSRVFPAIAAQLEIQEAKFGNFSGGCGAALLSLQESDIRKNARPRSLNQSSAAHPTYLV